MSIEDVWAYPAPPERKYRKAADSKAQLIAAGRELLAERGLAPGLSRVTLNDAIERSGIPRSSAYRLYSGGPGPLESFRVALLESLSADHLDRDNTWGSVDGVIEQHTDDLDGDDPVRMATALREVIRVGVSSNIQDWIGSIGFYVVASTMVAASSPGTDSGADLELLQGGEDQLLKNIIPVYKSIADMVGLRLRSGLDWETFARVITSAVDGVALRHVIDPSLMAIERPTGPDGEIQEWTSAAVLFESMVYAYTEPDPKRTMSADLSVWY